MFYAKQSFISIQQKENAHFVYPRILSLALDTDFTVIWKIINPKGKRRKPLGKKKLVTLHSCEDGKVEIIRVGRKEM